MGGWCFRPKGMRTVNVRTFRPLCSHLHIVKQTKSQHTAYPPSLFIQQLKRLNLNKSGCVFKLRFRGQSPEPDDYYKKALLPM